MKQENQVDRMFSNIIVSQIKYPTGGQDIAERTENALLDPEFDMRFQESCCFPIKSPGIGFADRKPHKKQGGYFIDSGMSTGRKIIPTQLEMLISSDPLYSRIRGLVSRENIFEYVRFAKQPLIETILEGGFSGTVVELHEGIEIHELFKGYQAFCRETGQRPASSIDDFFSSIGRREFGCEYSDSSVKSFFESGTQEKARHEAHRKALIGEFMFIYHLSKSLGYSLNFAALIDAFPLRQTETDKADKEFVKKICHGFEKTYSPEDLKKAEQFYRDVGCDGFGKGSGPYLEKEFIRPHHPPGHGPSMGECLIQREREYPL